MNAVPGSLPVEADAVAIEPPLAMLCELTHRCPLRCSYCSNPVALEGASHELSTAEWQGLMDQAARLGVLQVHFSGGEPTARRDLPVLVRHAVEQGLYTNLITSGVLVDQAMADTLADAGLEHAQIGFPDITEEGSTLITAFKGGLARKYAAAAALKQAGVALTMNAVITRHNVERLPQMFEVAQQIGARRIEVANVQYYGWGLLNRAALMPSPQQLAWMTGVVTEARARLKGQLAIDYVIPDYYAKRPKACLGGWGRQFLNVTPSGKVLPCHAAETLKHLSFDSIRDRSLADIWLHGSAFAAYRGDAWMPKGCRSCEHKETDWGGCRCQALALAGKADAMDPTCEQSPLHASVRAMAEHEAAANVNTMTYRTFTDTAR
ncbi:pyrroloquinoline quinone biosynthesis protein PqqE [Insolitispirillum peregrinum]|uniref:pyrroloquinoline quinone biosynthesis protein PqqE n=1 Tax=Insolitispirillum peregrinum TaxID=80876 RepID=UPI00362181AC